MRAALVAFALLASHACAGDDDDATFPRAMLVVTKHVTPPPRGFFVVGEEMLAAYTVHNVGTECVAGPALRGGGWRAAPARGA